MYSLSVFSKSKILSRFREKIKRTYKNFYEKIRPNIELTPYANIKDPYKDVKNKYGDDFSYYKEKYIVDFESLNMDKFEGKNHCSLTSLTAIFNYYRENGYYKIDDNLDKLFENIRKIAEDSLYYIPDYGTFPIFIDKLSTKVFRFYGYEDGLGVNKLFFWDLKDLLKFLENEIDEARPGIISFSNGYYWNHSITFYGYVIFKNNLGDKKFYLRVNDNWTREDRYVDMTNLSTFDGPIFEITKISAPKLKM